MKDKLQVRVVTPDRPVHEGEAESVVVPSHDGEIGILPHHAHLLASLGEGVLRVSTGSEVASYYLEGGFVQVGANLVTVLCERATPVAELDVAAAQTKARLARDADAPDAGALERRAALMQRIIDSARQ